MREDGIDREVERLVAGLDGFLGVARDVEEEQV
jgi:hypothetical protein